MLNEMKGKIDMLSMIMEHKDKRTSARNNAIAALEGFIDGDVSEDDYNMAVAEYADALVDIHAKEAAHLEWKGE